MLPWWYEWRKSSYQMGSGPDVCDEVGVTFLWTFVRRLLPFTDVLSSDRSVVLHGDAKGRLPMWAP